MKSNKKALSTAAEPLKEGVMSNGIRCRLIVAVAVLMAFIFSSGVVSAEETVAGFVGENVMKGLQSMGKARVSTAKSSARIKKARAEYWAQFPDGPGLQEAQERFTELLVSKDLFYLQLHLASSVVRGEKETQAWVKNSAEKLGGAIDNGLWPGTEGKFYGWVRAFRNALKKDDPFMTKWTVNQKLADAAWEQSKEKYAAYKRARDCAELRAAMDGLSFKNTKELTLAIISSEKDFAEKQDAAERYRKMVVNFGEKELHTAAEEVRRAQKDQFGRIINPSALGPFGDWHPYWALRGPLSRNSGKAYAWIVLGEDKYKDWTAVMPERELIAAADRLRVMPHLTTGSYPWHLDMDSSVYQALPMKYQMGSSMGQPESTLKLICGEPEHYDPRGASLDAANPDSYMVAVIRNNNPQITRHEARQEYRTSGLIVRARKEGHAAIEKVRKAPKDKQHRLKDPQALGISTSDPVQAVKELLQGDLSSRRIYIALCISQHGLDFEKWAGFFYDKLVAPFGEEHVAPVAQLVWQCMEEGGDYSKLKGSVSGFKGPLSAFYDILISTVPVEKYVYYLYSSHYRNDAEKKYAQYGKEAILAAAKKVAVAPKIASRGFPLPERLAHASSVGLVLPSDPPIPCRSAVEKLADPQKTQKAPYAQKAQKAQKTQKAQKARDLQKAQYAQKAQKTRDQTVTSDGSEEIKDSTMRIRISGSTEYDMTIKLKDFTKESKNPKGYRQGFFINFVLPSELNNSRIMAVFFNNDSKNPSIYMYYPKVRRIKRYSKAQLENNKFEKTSLTLKEIFDTAVKLVYRDQVTVNGSTVSVINRKLGYIDPREFLLSNLQKSY
jgi:hypothetical protein